MTQNKLTDTQKEDCHKIATLFGGAFNWDDTPEGYEYWKGITNKLRDMAKHGTSDGKPWVEPEPEIPPGWRKAEPDEWQRTDVKFWSSEKNLWVSRFHQGLPFDPLRLGRTYIVPIDPPLTDRDAAQWPRPLVMVRSDDLAPWEGPYAYLGKTESFYAVDSLGKTVFVLWGQARRATPAEIEAAK